MCRGPGASHLQEAFLDCHSPTALLEQHLLNRRFLLRTCSA